LKVKDAATALSRLDQVRALRVLWTLQAFGPKAAQQWNKAGNTAHFSVLVLLLPSSLQSGVPKIARDTLKSQAFQE
jgi:hypothetical protein